MKKNYIRKLSQFSYQYSFETLDYFLESYDLLKDNSAANIQNYLVW